MQIHPKTAFWILLLALVLPGLVGFIVFGAYALIDWTALQAAYTHYEQMASSSADLRAVFIAESNQNIHRINLLADGVWALLSGLIAAIGLHGICRNKS